MSAVSIHLFSVFNDIWNFSEITSAKFLSDQIFVFRLVSLVTVSLHVFLQIMRFKFSIYVDHQLQLQFNRLFWIFCFVFEKCVFFLVKIFNCGEFTWDYGVLAACVQELDCLVCLKFNLVLVPNVDGIGTDISFSTTLTVDMTNFHACKSFHRLFLFYE